MTWHELISTINTSFFFNHQLPRLFPTETKAQINSQLWRWTKQGKLIRLKQGLYIFSQAKINDFKVSNLLYQPSYVSLESVLNSYGLIPDIPWEVTAVNPLTTKKFQTAIGSFSYHKLKPELFFGYTVFAGADDNDSYLLAESEKALLDLIYVRQISDFSDIRLDVAQLNQERLTEFSALFPGWVQKSIEKILNS